MVGPVHDLVGTDTVGVIHELQEGLSAATAHFLELPAVPGECIAIEGGGIADRVIGNGSAVNRRELIAPSVAVGIDHFLVIQRSEIARCVIVGLFACTVAALVVSVGVGLAQNAVVLAGQLAEIVANAMPSLPAEQNALRAMSFVVNWYSSKPK